MLASGPRGGAPPLAGGVARCAQDTRPVMEAGLEWRWVEPRPRTSTPVTCSTVPGLYLGNMLLLK